MANPVPNALPSECSIKRTGAESPAVQSNALCPQPRDRPPSAVSRFLEGYERERDDEIGVALRLGDAEVPLDLEAEPQLDLRLAHRHFPIELLVHLGDGFGRLEKDGTDDPTREPRDLQPLMTCMIGGRRAG
jgi:hypothetical protein